MGPPEGGTATLGGSAGRNADPGLLFRVFVAAGLEAPSADEDVEVAALEYLVEGEETEAEEGEEGGLLPAPLLPFCWWMDMLARPCPLGGSEGAADFKDPFVTDVDGVGASAADALGVVVGASSDAGDGRSEASAFVFDFFLSGSPPFRPATGAGNELMQMGLLLTVQ